MSATQKLSELKIGAEARIHGFAPEFREAGRLREMGLLPGTKVQLVLWAPLGDPLEIKIRGYHLSLRKHEADSIEVLVPTA